MTDMDTATFLDAVAGRVSLVDLVREVTPLRRVGRQYRGPCPLHHGTHPNFEVHPARHVFHCFKCGEAGDMVDFLIKCDRFQVSSFPDALTYLADRTGLTRPPLRGFNTAAREAAEREAADIAWALDFAARYYEFASTRLPDLVTAGTTALGISPTLAPAFELGVARPDHPLTNNLLHRVPPERWLAFKQLGLVDYEGITNMEAARATMRDTLPSGLVWTLRDLTGHLVGLAEFDAQGAVVRATEIARGVDPRRGRLVLASGPQTPAPAPAVLVANPADVWDLPTPPPYRLVIPGLTRIAHGDSLTHVLRGETPTPHGLIRGTTGPADWVRPDVFEWIDGVVEQLDQTVPLSVCHPVECAVVHDDTRDWEPVIDALGDPIQQIACRGWLRERRDPTPAPAR